MPSNDLIAVTSMVGKILDARLLTATAATTVYTVPANTGAIVKKALVCNVSTSSPTTLTVSVTKAGGSAIAIVSGYIVAALDTVDLTELTGLMLGPGDVLACTANIANNLNVVLSGTENS